MTTKRKINIEFVNLLLLLVSFGLSIYLPFLLFLGAYAFIGPLHYTTEINWLKSKNFYCKSESSTPILLIILAGAASFIPVASKFSEAFNTVEFWTLQNYIFFTCMFLALLLSALELKSNSNSKLSVLIGLSLLASAAYSYSKLELFSIFLPSLVHVYLFTVLFMANGAKSSKNGLGWLNASLLFISPLVYYALPDELFTLSNISGEDAYASTSFNGINEYISNTLFSGASGFNLKIQSFISFTYCYHFLNWFSKTETIGWQNQMKPKKWAVSLGIWIISVTLYCYNYSLGLTALFFLSLLHVLLEFPLNFNSLIGLFSKMETKKEGH